MLNHIANVVLVVGFVLFIVLFVYGKALEELIKHPPTNWTPGVTRKAPKLLKQVNVLWSIAGSLTFLSFLFIIGNWSYHW